MKELAEKLKVSEETMANERGPFDLFALFLREDAPGKWDLVVAADWIDKSKEESFKYIASVIQETLTTDELLILSRIVLIDEDNPGLDAIHRFMQVEHGIAEIQDCSLFGLQFKHGYLITSRMRSNGTPNTAINRDV